MNQKTEKKSLSVRDLATIGIFSAVMFALTMVTGAVTGIVPVLYLFSPALFGVVAGPMFMLIAAKVHKTGAVVIPSLLIGLLWSLMGGISVLGFMAVLGIIGEIIATKTKYDSFKALVFAYVLLVAGYYLGAIGPIYFFTDWWLSFSEGYDSAYVESVLGAAMSWISIVAVPVTLLAAVVGAVFGKRLLRRHFEKAGIV
jgi:energy-coupling factor transport system substrate-specific component